MAIKRQFFDMYIVKELPKSDIISTLNITERTYVTLVKMAKEWDKTELNTAFLEQLTVHKLLVDPNNEDALKTARDIWKFKHKIPSQQKEEDIPSGFFEPTEPVHT